MWDELKDILDNPFPLYYLMWSLIVIVADRELLIIKANWFVSLWKVFESLNFDYNEDGCLYEILNVIAVLRTSG